MDESRYHPRTAFRFALNLFRSNDRQSVTCVSHDICRGGLFAAGVHGFRENEPVRVVIGPDRADALHLNARVVRTENHGLACEFVDNSPASLEVLDALLTPTWDGENLLDGVMRFAPWGRHDDLAGWMRLTSLVSDWQRLGRQHSGL